MANDYDSNRVKLTLFIPASCSIKQLIKIAHWAQRSEFAGDDTRGDIHGALVEVLVKDEYRKDLIAELEAAGGIII